MATDDDPVERWLTSDDSWRLSVLDVPSVGPARAIALVGHAMMVDRRTMVNTLRPSLATTLAARGVRCLVPDLRGHGRSGPNVRQGGAWSYDRLVADVPLYVELARELAPGVPIVSVGNSLFGHLTLAHLGRDPSSPIAALVGFGVCIWNRRWTPDLRRWLLKRAVIASSLPVVRALGHLPVKRLKLGTCDEPRGYWHSMQRWIPHDVWDADDGFDYAAALYAMDRPYLHVLSEGDTLLSHPDDAAAYLSALGERREELRLGPGCSVAELREAFGRDNPPPGHVEMVHHPRCEPLWRWVADWIVETTAAASEVDTVDGVGSRR